MKKVVVTISFAFIYLISFGQVNINRYSNGIISLKGIAGNKNIDKEVIIPEVDIKQVFKKWENSKISKFAESVVVDISPFKQGLW